MTAASHPDASTPFVVCLLVNWNGWQDTLACLESLAQQDHPGLHTIVVDNGSTDDSVERIRASFPTVEVIESATNLGFAGGNNLGLRRALALDADFVWLLNNDTSAPPDTCRKLVAKAQMEPDAGLIGSVLYFMRDPARIQAWGGGRVIPWLARSSHFIAPARLEANSYLTFASVFIRREVLEKVGLLDERYFMYFEDADYSFRVVAAGFCLRVAETTTILHREGGSDTSRRSIRTDRYATASGLVFLSKHAPLPVLSQIVFLVLRLANRIFHGRWSNIRAVLQGIADFHHR